MNQLTYGDMEQKTHIKLKIPGHDKIIKKYDIYTKLYGPKHEISDEQRIYEINTTEKAINAIILDPNIFFYLPKTIICEKIFTTYMIYRQEPEK